MDKTYVFLNLALACPFLIGSFYVPWLLMMAGEWDKATVMQKYEAVLIWPCISILIGVLIYFDYYHLGFLFPKQ